MGTYDIIIAGAGISGLILASELSKKFSVLIIEKSNEEQTVSKYWLTPYKCLEFNPDLHSCVDMRYGEMDFISHDEKKFRINGDYILWDSDLLSNYLKNKILSNGSQIIYSHRFYNYKLFPSLIKVHANEKTFDSKLLIDCMGYSSPLIHLCKDVNIFGYFVVYGGIIPLKKAIDPIIMANLLVDKNPHYLEIFPKKGNYANVAIIKPVSEIQSPYKLKNDFDFIIKKSHYSEYFDIVEDYRELGGLVSIGNINKVAFDRILFFGEAGQLQPALTNTCLTKLLLYHRDYSTFIERKILNHNLTKKDLLQHPKTMNEFSRRFQIQLYKEILKWDSLDFSRFIDFLNSLDNKSLNDFIFDEISLSYFVEPHKLFKVLQTRNLIWLKPFMRSVLKTY